MQKLKLKLDFARTLKISEFSSISFEAFLKNFKFPHLQYFCSGTPVFSESASVEKILDCNCKAGNITESERRECEHNSRNFRESNICYVQKPKRRSSTSYAKTLIAKATCERKRNENTR